MSHRSTGFLVGTLLATAGPCLSACDGPTSRQSASPSSSSASSRGHETVLPSLTGEQVRLVTPTDDGVMVLAFWATWCQPCQQELANMNELYADLKHRGLEIYAVNIDGPDTQAQVDPWVTREGYDFVVVMDRETHVLTRYNPRGDIPYYVVLDASGKVLKDHQGYMTGDTTELKAFLNEVLPNPG